MSPKAIIVVSAQISPSYWAISAHHDTKDGERRAQATFGELVRYSKRVGITVVYPKPIYQR
jgi:hypothetical protein